jgi:predicted membrane chloride channel (bestrophin family)
MMARVAWAMLGALIFLWTCTLAFGLVYDIAGFTSAVLVSAIISWAILQVLERARIGERDDIR